MKSDKKKKNNFRNCIIFDKTIFVFAQNRFDRTETYLFLEGINGISYRYIVGRQIRGEIIGLKRNILAERFIAVEMASVDRIFERLLPENEK